MDEMGGMGGRGGGLKYTNDMLEHVFYLEVMLI